MDRLEAAEKEAYRAAYCGLCRALGKGYGFRCRFLVNYDMTFLYLLRASWAPAGETRACWCPARVCGRKNCTLDVSGFDPVTTCTVILAVEKLRDNVKDSGFFKGLLYRFLFLLFRRPYKKAARRLPAFAALVRSQLEALDRLEQAESPSIDATADAFARITAGCAADLESPTLRRPLEQILYQTGRFLYLADALDDLKEDCKTGSYNPLRFRFRPVDGVLPPETLDYLTQLTDASVNLAGAALALLPGDRNQGLLENIIYLGFPAVFYAVKEGKFVNTDFRGAHCRRRGGSDTKETQT